MKKYEVKRLKEAFKRNSNPGGTKGKGSVTFHNMMHKLTWKQKKHVIEYMLKK